MSPPLIIYKILELMVQEQPDVAQLWIGLMNDLDGLRWMDGSPVSFLNWDEEQILMDQYKDNCIGKYGDFCQFSIMI